MGEIIRRHGGYSLRWYEAGRRRVLASKQLHYAAAKRMLLEIEARVARGEAGIAERRVSWPTFAQLVPQFLAEYSRPKLKDPAAYRQEARSSFRRVMPWLEKLKVNEIESIRISKLRDALHGRFSAATIRVTLSFLSTLFGWAVREKLAPHNPCRGVERPAVQHAIDFLSRAEVQQLLRGLAQRSSTVNDRMLHVCVAMAIYTGLRKGELFGLRWSDLDLETRRLTVARSYTKLPKSGKPRHLRLPKILLPLLHEWRNVCPRSPAGLVFPIGRGPTRTATNETMLGLPRALVSLGLRVLPHPWHALRHTFASHFVMAGGNILALQKILGHSDLKLTLVYAHLAPDFLDGEMDRLEF